MSHISIRYFIKNVIQQPAVYDDSAYSNTIGNILKHKRIYRFEKAINQFLQNCGQAPVPHFELKTSEKNLLTFSLQLSGYIRDAQKALNKMSNAHACDPDLIKLYDAAAEYSVACNNQREDSKYIFHEHCDDQIWKVNIQDKLANATFDNDNIEIIYSLNNKVKLISNTNETILDNKNTKKIINS